MIEENIDKKTSYIIGYSRIVTSIFIICTILFGAGFFFSMAADAGLFCYVVFGFLAVLGLYGAVVSAVWKIKIDGDEICYYSIIGVKHRYSFDDITNAIEFNHFGNNAVCCYAGRKKMFTIDNNIAGYFLFIMDLNMHKISIDKSRRRENDPMNKYEDMTDKLN